MIDYSHRPRSGGNGASFKCGEVIFINEQKAVVLFFFKDMIFHKDMSAVVLYLRGATVAPSRDIRIFDKEEGIYVVMLDHFKGEAHHSDPICVIPDSALDPLRTSAARIWKELSIPMKTILGRKEFRVEPKNAEKTEKPDLKRKVEEPPAKIEPEPHEQAKARTRSTVDPPVPVAIDLARTRKLLQEGNGHLSALQRELSKFAHAHVKAMGDLAAEIQETRKALASALTAPPSPKYASVRPVRPAAAEPPPPTRRYMTSSVQYRERSPPRYPAERAYQRDDRSERDMGATRAYEYDY